MVTVTSLSCVNDRRQSKTWKHSTRLRNTVNGLNPGVACNSVVWCRVWVVLYNEDFIQHNTHRPTTTTKANDNTTMTTATIPYIKGISENISHILQPFNIRITHKPITTLHQLLTNIKDRDEPRNRPGAVYKISRSDCHASCISETGRNLTTRLTEHKRVMRKGDVNNHIAEHHRLMNHTIDWDSAQCLTYSTNYFQRLTLESWFTNLEQTPLNRCQPLPAPYKRLIHNINITNEPNRTT